MCDDVLGRDSPVLPAAAGAAVSTLVPFPAWHDTLHMMSFKTGLGCPAASIEGLLLAILMSLACFCRQA